jgi:hypothetical protein
VAGLASAASALYLRLQSEESFRLPVASHGTATQASLTRVGPFRVFSLVPATRLDGWKVQSLVTKACSHEWIPSDELHVSLWYSLPVSKSLPVPEL